MASKSAAKKPDPRGKGVAKRLDNAPSTDVMKMMERDAGVGVSHKAEDNIVPLLYVLQAQSPQAIKGNKEAYVKGAEAGSIWPRGTAIVHNGVIDDDTGMGGILFLPCHYHKEWVEWKKNREGFVMRHLTPDDSRDPPKGAVPKTDDKGNDFLEMPSGNVVSQTRSWAGYMLNDDLSVIGSIVIPMTGSNIHASKTWNGLLRRKTLPSGKEAPIYSHVYRLGTVFRSNDKGDWYMWDVRDGGVDNDGAAVPMMVPSVELFNLGKKLHEDFTSGAVRPDTPDDESGNRDGDL